MDTTQSKKTVYTTFLFMMLVSCIIMYAVMFLNVFEWDHIYNSLTRTYMTLLMVAPMAVSMLFFKWGMYPNIKKNIFILCIAATTFILSLLGLRSQTFIGDVQWMKAMIPHHSSAILTSNKAQLSNPEVIQLSEDIIEAQKREIALMKRLINKLENQQE